VKRKIFLFLILFINLNSSLYAQVPSIQWAKCFGGGDYDRAYCVRQTFDGGFIVVGYTASVNGNVIGNHGDEDVWVIKLDSLGNIVWQKCLGGTWSERAYDIKQLPDSGFVIAGYSDSFDGDVTNVHGLSFDYWLVKLDKTGIIEWQKCLGGSDSDQGMSVTGDLDHGYAIVGEANSSDGDVSFQYGSGDFWVAKTDSTGNLIWQKSLGGTDYEFYPVIINSLDSGYVIAGYSSSPDGDVTGNHGVEDGWIVKINSTGAIVWQKAIGGSWSDGIKSIKATYDQGYIVAGSTQSNDFDVSGNHGSEDCWLVKLNSSGNIIWQKCFGGSNVDDALSVSTTSDSGYILVGQTGSNDGQITNWLGGTDIWIVKTDRFGNLEWQKSIGGSAIERPYSIEQTRDGGYILGGYTSSNDSDVMGNHSPFPYEDAWIVKLAPIGMEIMEEDLFKDFTSYFDVIKNLQVRFYSNKVEELEIQLLDISGRVLSHTQFKSNSGFNHFQLTNLEIASGIYFIQLSNQASKIVKKVFR
jgi:hypothetical protein